jgi:acetoin utilization protein AcuB
MKNKIPLIKSVMTPFPYSVESNTLLSDAREYMVKHGIHHLPVTDGDRIAGLLNQNDVMGNGRQTVGDAGIETPQVVDLNERLDNILMIMADRHIDTVLVTKNNKLVGIFTYTDACRQFAGYLRREFGPHNGNTAA